MVSTIDHIIKWENKHSLIQLLSVFTGLHPKLAESGRKKQRLYPKLAETEGKCRGLSLGQPKVTPKKKKLLLSSLATLGVPKKLQVTPSQH